MLNRALLIEEISRRSSMLFTALDDELERALTLWQGVTRDKAFSAKAESHNHRYVVPTWSGQLDACHTLNPISHYDVVACDGSQVYPDRHQGIDCFMINIGRAHFQYNPVTSHVSFDSVPSITFAGEVRSHECTPEMVDAQRTEMELKSGVTYLKSLTKELPALFMFDGSLIFWHLQIQKNDTHQNFFPKYLSLLDDFFASKILIAGYISLSKSKELINLIKIAAELQDQNNQFDYLVDGHIARSFLKKGERSTVFANHSAIVAQYPEHSRPYFFYLNTGDEIARVEIPAWIALDKVKLDLVAFIIYDQVLKGYGYPISLAEAHEQAVVAHQDREFFFYLLQSMAQKENSSFSPSYKSLKKRRASI